MSDSKLKDKLAKVLFEWRKKNPNLFLPIEDILTIIKQERQTDHALKILIPNFDEFVRICSRPVDSVVHESMVVMCVRNHELDVILNAIHKFIIYENGKPRASEQYIADLSELHWWGQKTEADRYRVGNIYFGRLYELILANWLDERGDKVINMEAWNKLSPDIVTEKSGLRSNIQVKYIPQYKVDFEQDCHSSMSPRFGFVDCEAAVNNMTRHVDIAASQLKDKKAGLRVVAIVIDNRSVHSYFINQETCCRNDKEVLEFQRDLYKREDIDELRIYSNQGISVRPFYHFDIKNKTFMKYAGM